LALATKVTPAIRVFGSLLNMARRAKLVAHTSVEEMMVGFQSGSMKNEISCTFIRWIEKLYRNIGKKRKLPTTLGDK
jgi:hypothetical protein